MTTVRWIRMIQNFGKDCHDQCLQLSISVAWQHIFEKHDYGTFDSVIEHSSSKEAARVADAHETCQADQA